MSRSIFPSHFPWTSTATPDNATMVDKQESQQRGRQLGLLSPKKRGQSVHPNGSSQAPPTPPPPTRESSTAFGVFMSPLRRFTPAPAPPPMPKPVPMREALPIGPPSVKIPPLRRLAPQRGLTGRPVREEPLLRPPPPNRRRVKLSGEHSQAFVTNQCKLIPLYAGRPREEQDKMLENYAPRPRDITFLPRLSMSSAASSLKFPEKKLLTDMPPPASLKDDTSIQHRGFDSSSSSSFVDNALDMLNSTSPPIFGPPLTLPYPSTAPVTPEENGPRVADLRDQPPIYQLPVNPPLSPERPTLAGSVKNMLPRMHPANLQSNLNLEDPFKHLNQAYKPLMPLANHALQQPGDPALSLTPGKRYPQLPYPAKVASSERRVSGNRKSSGRCKSGPLSNFQAKPDAYRPSFLPPYRPKTPPAGWFLSQNQFNGVHRSASLPEIPTICQKTFAERSLKEKPFRPVGVKLDFEPLPIGPVRKPVNMNDSRLYRPLPMDKFQHSVTTVASKSSEPQAKLPDVRAYRELPPLPAKDPIPPVKFIDYTQIPSPRFAKFTLGRGPRILMERERPGPFDMGEAKIFALKLLTALLPVKNNQNPSPREIQLFAEASDIVAQWLLSYPVNVSPQCTGVTYGIFLFRAAEWLGNNWFTVAALPLFLNDNWGMPCVNIEGQELSYEWYLKVQDVFFRSVIEGYNNCLKERFVVLGDTAYPMNTIVPKTTGGPEGMGVADHRKDEYDAVNYKNATNRGDVAYILQPIAGGSDRTTQKDKGNLGGKEKTELDDDRTIKDVLMGDCPE